MVDLCASCWNPVYPTPFGNLGKKGKCSSSIDLLFVCVCCCCDCMIIVLYNLGLLLAAGFIYIYIYICISCLSMYVLLALQYLFHVY